MKLIHLVAAGFLTAASATLVAQTSGTSHPEDLNDNITVAAPAPAPVSSDHYREPSQDVPASSSAQSAVAPSVSAAPATAWSVPAAVSSVPAAVSSVPSTASAVPSTASAVPSTASAVPSTVSVASVSASTASAAPAAAELVPRTSASEQEAARVGYTFDPNDPTSGVVLARPTQPNELVEGTLLRVTLDDTLSSAEVHRGQPFSAHLTTDILSDGRVLLPAGSQIHGRIAEVRQAKRFGPAAMLRLQPDTITLPDGREYLLNAQVVDFGATSEARHDARVTNEGAVVANNHTKAKIAGVTFTTGTATIAGAILGGGVGAAVGAGIGAGAGIIWWGRQQDHSETLAQGTVMILNLDHPLFIGTQTATASPLGE